MRNFLLASLWDFFYQEWNADNLETHGVVFTNELVWVRQDHPILPWLHYQQKVDVDALAVECGFVKLEHVQFLEACHQVHDWLVVT